LEFQLLSSFSVIISLKDAHAALAPLGFFQKENTFTLFPVCKYLSFPFHLLSHLSYESHLGDFSLFSRVRNIIEDQIQSFCNLGSPFPDGLLLGFSSMSA